jgi:hypothetical protein
VVESRKLVKVYLGIKALEKLVKEDVPELPLLAGREQLEVFAAYRYEGEKSPPINAKALLCLARLLI